MDGVPEKEAWLTPRRKHMKFTPKTEEELAMDGLLPEGVYDFEVIEALNKVSKNGNEMIQLKLKVYDENGGWRFVTDFLLESFLPKLHSFAKATGTLKAYETGEFDSYNCLNTSGKVQIKIKPAGEYPARNEVKFYGEPKAKTEKSEAPLETSAPESYKPNEQAPVIEDEDIPF
jgi:hypothetical protein